MIATAVKRGQNLTGHLLSFARRQTLEATVVDLPELLPKLEEMLRRSLRGDIEIRARVLDGPCRVRVDPGELELAVLNLGVNARDAMPDGGILSFSVRRALLAGDSDVDGLRGAYVLMELSDTGIGIPPEALPRVFDPFFTTKDAGKGTGLGLSQVYGFAKQSGGTAIIRSQPGQGTTVGIYLPSTDAPVAVERPMTPVDATGREKGIVLLVEDSQDVAAVSADYFGQLGYDVDHAVNGAEALSKLRGRRSYDLVFSDILMPGTVAGLELARIVRGHHAEIPILLTTGYSEKAQQAVDEGFYVLRKPYDLKGLADAVRELRHRPPHAKGASSVTHA
jgi:two-component system NtrC family sensor kinase